MKGPIIRTTNLDKIDNDKLDQPPSAEPSKRVASGNQEQPTSTPISLVMSFTEIEWFRFTAPMHEMRMMHGDVRLLGCFFDLESFR